jgi:hypothetical protein
VAGAGRQASLLAHTEAGRSCLSTLTATRPTPPPDAGSS